MASESTARFAGKVAIVTGGGTGIGAAIAAHLAAAGAEIAIVGRRGHVVQRHADQLREQGYSALPVRADVSVDAENIVRQVVQHFGRLDVLVNNAAISAGVDLEEMSLDQWHQVLAINLDAAFLLAKSAIPHLAMTRGNLLHISSIGAVVGEFDDIAYATSKAALAGITKTVAAELLDAGILLNTVNPGPVNTGYLDPETADRDVSWVPGYLAGTPFGRFGRPEDPARLIAWPCSDAGSWMVGQVLTSDGGFSLHQ